MRFWELDLGLDKSRFEILFGRLLGGDNTASMYSAVIYGAGITWDGELIQRGLSRVREVMAEDGLEFFYLRLVAPASSTAQLSKALNRSVTGLMNEFVAHAKYWLAEGELSPFEVSFKLNETPMAPHGYANPRETLKSLKPELCETR